MYATFCEHNWLSTALFDNSRWSRTNSIPSTPRPSSHNHWKCSRTSGLSQENKPIAYNTVVSCKNLNVIMGELSINSISFLTKMLNKIIVRRHESIVLQKLSIMLLSFIIILKCQHNFSHTYYPWNYAGIITSSLMMRQILLLHYRSSCYVSSTVREVLFSECLNHYLQCVYTVRCYQWAKWRSTRLNDCYKAYVLDKITV